MCGVSSHHSYLVLYWGKKNMKNDYCVYKHVCPNGKIYIGVTGMKPEQRWKNGNGYKTNQYFNRAILKYGWNNFKHEILFKGLTREEAEKKEIELIAYYKSNQKEFGYNIQNGGSFAGKHSEETKRKMSERMIGDTRNKGRIHTEESRMNMSKSRIGRKLTEETKRKLSEINTGKRYTDDVIEHIKIAKRKSQSFPVYCVELNKTFDSVPEAVEYINHIGGSVIRQGIQKVIKGIINASGSLSDGTKLHWERVDI